MPKALAEFHRVLRPAGKVGITMSLGHDPQWQWFDDLLSRYDQEQPVFVDYGARGQGVNRNPEGLARALAAAGFQNIHTVSVDHEFVYAGAAEWWDALWTHGTRSPLEQMPAEMLARFKAECLAHLPNMAQAGGYPMQRTTIYTIASK